MTSRPDARSRELFMAALAEPPESRERFLCSRCPDDDDLRSEVLSLLAYHDADGEFMDRPAMEELPSDPFNGRDTPLPPLAAGDRIGRYTIVEPIGEGGMGVVYTARQDFPERLLAIKVLRPGLVRASTRRRFRIEAQALARLQHPDIAQIIEAGVAGDGDQARPYLVMELVRGLPLIRHALERGLSLPQRLELFARICHAVHHAHQRGVIHRDLKPANILVTDAGDPKILDFGIARVTSDADDATAEHTGAMRLIGTLPYMSPEQLGADPAAVTAAADVYALGVILYELVSGRPPLDVAGLPLAAAARRIAHDDPPRLSSIDRRARGDLDLIAATALHKDPQRRYASAAAIAADIHSFLAHEPIAARAPTTIYQLTKLARRHRAAAGALAGIGAALAVGSIAVTLALVRAVDAELQAEANLVSANAAAGRAQTIGEFLRRTLASAGPSFAQGRDATLLREMLDKAAADSFAIDPAQPEARAEVQQTIGETYSAIGEFAKAEAMFQSALATRLELHGEEHPDTMRTLNAMAFLSLERSDYFDAAPRFRRVLGLRTAVLGPDHPDTLGSAVGLARALLEWVDEETYEEGIALCNRTLEAQRRILGPRHQEVVASLITVGLAQRRAGRLDEAEAALREALDIRRELFGDDAPEIASLLVNLGSVRRHAGDLEAAEELLSQGIGIRRRELGDRHASLAWPTLELAEIRLSQGRLTDAEALVRSVIALVEHSLGPTHAQVGEAMEVLARVDLAAGRRDDAVAHYTRAAALLSATYGEDHWRVSDLVSRAQAAAEGLLPGPVDRGSPPPTP